MPDRVKVFFDGGCRPGPGPMEVAVVVSGRVTIRTDIGHGTSADAEWLALIEALTIARSFDLSDFVLMGDAADVIAKAGGELRCRPHEAHHMARFREAAAGARPRLRYVKRTQNLAGIALAARHPR